MPSPQIRLVVAEDDPLALQAIRAYLRSAPDIEVVGEAVEGVSALELVRRLTPDVLLTDINMPGHDGVELTGLVLALPHPPQVVCFTALAGDHVMREALLKGASGFLLKVDRPEVVLHGIRSAFNGESVVSPHLLAGVLATISRNSPPPPDLKETELHLLRLVSAGLNNVEIGEKLFLSPATVKTYLSRLLAKTGSRNRAQLAVKAHEWGLHRS